MMEAQQRFDNGEQVFAFCSLHPNRSKACVTSFHTKNDEVWCFLVWGEYGKMNNRMYEHCLASQCSFEYTKE